MRTMTIRKGTWMLNKGSLPSGFYSIVNAWGTDQRCANDLCAGVLIVYERGSGGFTAECGTCKANWTWRSKTLVLAAQSIRP